MNAMTSRRPDIACKLDFISPCSSFLESPISSDGMLDGKGVYIYIYSYLFLITLYSMLKHNCKVSV